MLPVRTTLLQRRRRYHFIKRLLLFSRSWPWITKSWRSLRSISTQRISRFNEHLSSQVRVWYHPQCRNLHKKLPSILWHSFCILISRVSSKNTLYLCKKADLDSWSVLKDGNQTFEVSNERIDFQWTRILRPVERS